MAVLSGVRVDMRLTASRLRQDIYRILDEVLESGIPVEIEVIVEVE